MVADSDRSRLLVADERAYVCVYAALKERSFLLSMKLWRHCNMLLDRVSDVLWRMFEVHIFKVIVFAIFFSCVNEVMLPIGLHYCILFCL